MRTDTARSGVVLRTAALGLVLVAACGYPRTRTVLADPHAAAVTSATVHVVDASRHGLATPRLGGLEVLAGAFGHGSPAVSAVDAFSMAADDALRARGIRVATGDGATPLLRIEIVAFEVHRDEEAQAVACAFVSATYALVTAEGIPLWKAEQYRMQFPLVGPDLTRSELARIAGQAVDAGLASLPTSTKPHA